MIIIGEIDNHLNSARFVIHMSGNITYNDIWFNIKTFRHALAGFGVEIHATPNAGRKRLIDTLDYMGVVSFYYEAY